LINPLRRPKNEQMPVVRIALERLLHQHRQAVEPLAHVGMTGRQPYLGAARNRDHRRSLVFSSPSITAETSEASTGPLILIRPPAANSISIVETNERGEVPAVYVNEDTIQRVAEFQRRFLLSHAVMFYTEAFGLTDNHDDIADTAGYILPRNLDHLSNRVMARGSDGMRRLAKDKKTLEAAYHQLETLGWITGIPGRGPLIRPGTKSTLRCMRAMPSRPPPNARGGSVCRTSSPRRPPA
jgi:hypothetical protein